VVERHVLGRIVELVNATERETSNEGRGCGERIQIGDIERDEFVMNVEIVSRILRLENLSINEEGHGKRREKREAKRDKDKYKER
jgi:hypothetical protein